MLSGQVITGTWLSLTVTVKVHLSPVVLLQVTVVTPAGKVDPEGMSQVTVPQLFAEGAGYVTTALHWPGSVFWTTLAGQLSTQGGNVKYATGMS